MDYSCNVRGRGNPPSHFFLVTLEGTTAFSADLTEMHFQADVKLNITHQHHTNTKTQHCSLQKPGHESG